MFYGEFEPAPQLKPYIASYWQFRVPDELDTLVHTVPPDGGVSLSYSVALGGFGLVGPRLIPFQPQVQGGDQFWGIRFWPGASEPLLHVPTSELRDRSGPAIAFCTQPWLRHLNAAMRDCRDEAAVRQVFDTGLEPALTDADALDELVMNAVFTILHTGGNIRIADLAERAGLSERQLRRRFTLAVGLSPKELTRVRRVRASIIGSLEEAPEPWVELAFAHGYADQPHLAHEFRRLVGLSPEQLKEHLRRIVHGDFEG